MSARVLPFDRRKVCGCRWNEPHTLDCLWSYLHHASNIRGLTEGERSELEAFRELVQESL